MEVEAATGDAEDDEAWCTASWTCDKCGALNSAYDGIYVFTCCSACKVASPAVRMCAEQGWMLVWVKDDNDCAYHSILDAVVHKAGSSLSVYGADYDIELLRIREFVARSLTLPEVSANSVVVLVFDVGC